MECGTIVFHQAVHTPYSFHCVTYQHVLFYSYVRMYITTCYPTCICLRMSYHVCPVLSVHVCITCVPTDVFIYMYSSMYVFIIH